MSDARKRRNLQTKSSLGQTKQIPSPRDIRKFGMPQRKQTILVFLALLLLFYSCLTTTIRNESTLPYLRIKKTKYDKEYPLKSLGIKWTEQSYDRGFWQRTKPYPLNYFKSDIFHREISCQEPIDVSRLPDWQRRVPYVMIIGSQKGGTTAMAYYLYNHPSIPYVPSKELHFFDETMDQLTQKQPSIITMNGTQVLHMYLNTAVAKDVSLEKLQQEQHLHLLDATPNYLFVSDRTPKRIFCASPWVKLLAILRNPVDRVWSQYHMQKNHDYAEYVDSLKKDPQSTKAPPRFLTFEEYIDLDMKILKELGIILPNHGSSSSGSAAFHKYSGSLKEYKAWQTYTKLGLNSPLGRGLYSIQLRHWFEAMEEFNKPREDFMILQTENMLQNSSEVYNEVLQFLNLPQHELKKFSVIHKTNFGTIPEEMKTETRKRLEDFYRPYNRQLEDLLGPAWKNVWE